MLLSVSVDLDEIHHYRAIHGLPALPGPRLVYERAVPRLRDWARQRGLPLTWFVVGRDAEQIECAEALSRLASDGDELGCHSYSHYYDLTRRSTAEIRLELESGAAAIQRCTPHKLMGFRAPGYTVSDALLDLVREVGFAYDCSVFPSPAYYALKAAALATLAARGCESKAIWDMPGAVRAPTVPYRVGRPYWYRGTGVWEIPIQVTRRARLPFIGTFLAMAGAVGARLLAKGVLGQRWANLELHGIDALDEHDGLFDVAQRQPDLKVPWSKKLEAIGAAIELLRDAGYVCVRMDELAAHAAST